MIKVESLLRAKATFSPADFCFDLVNFLDFRFVFVKMANRKLVMRDGRIVG